MQEHPVPQNVTGYEFHLIGQMTLKQFMEVAGGILIAVIVNTTNLPSIVKYPIMVIFALTGVALAFIPLEGRPLDRWFFAFIKSIYQPTLFYWKKTDTTPEVFTYTQPKYVDTSPTIDYKPLRESRVKEFLTSLPTAPLTTVASSGDELDVQASAVLSLFSDSPPPISVATPPPAPQVLPDPILPITLDPIPAQTLAQVPPQPEKSQQPVSQPVEVQVIPTAPIKIEPSSTPPLVATQRPQNTATTVFEDISANSGKALNASPAITNANLPFPSKPSVPNKIVGMVISKEQKIVDNAIVTVLRQQDGTPMRALKTNMLGQFEVVTPLENGTYIIEVEKDGHQFDQRSLTLSGKVIDPILLQAS